VGRGSAGAHRGRTRPTMLRASATPTRRQRRVCKVHRRYQRRRRMTTVACGIELSRFQRRRRRCSSTRAARQRDDRVVGDHLPRTER
jgi:hypothetical protein